MRWWREASVDLIDNGVDLALRIGPLDTSSLVARRLGEVRRMTVASPAYLQQHGIPATPEELGRHQLILGTAVRGCRNGATRPVSANTWSASRRACR